MKRKFAFAAATAASLTLVAAPLATAATTGATGPSSSEDPYLVPTHEDVSFTSLLTVGDKAGEYAMVGVPDGLGAFDNGDGTFTVLMNHELGGDKGVVREHGGKGAFISKWTFDQETLEVKGGEDLMKKVLVPTLDESGNPVDWTEETIDFSRFCSSDLAPAGTFLGSDGKGTNQRIYLTGEENGPAGRATASIVDGDEAGTTYVLPWLGHMSFENIVALPNTGDQTIVMLTDDSGGGEIYVYIGEKQAEGNPVERAGLVGGKLYGIAVNDLVDETDDAITSDSFTLVEVPEAATMDGDTLEAKSGELGITSFQRPEDAAWDPTDPNSVYASTTASFKGKSRLWKFTFNDVLNATVDGGQVKVAVESPDYDPTNEQGPRMLDNLTVNAYGEVIFVEDPGSESYIAGTWKYDPATGDVTKLAQHDPERFSEAAGSDKFMTENEESSGVIPATFLDKPGYDAYLIDVQAHLENEDPALVEHGQLLVMYLKNGEPTDEPTTEPTDEPTSEPTDEPTAEPTVEPTAEPTSEPTETAKATETPKPTAADGDKNDSNADGLASTGAENMTGLLVATAGLLAAGAGIAALNRRRAE